MDEKQRFTLELKETEFAKEYPEQFALLAEHGEELADFLRKGIKNVSFTIDPSTGTVTFTPVE